MLSEIYINNAQCILSSIILNILPLVSLLLLRALNDMIKYKI